MAEKIYGQRDLSWVLNPVPYSELRRVQNFRPGPLRVRRTAQDKAQAKHIMSLCARSELYF